MEFKGTKGEWKNDYQVVFIGEDHSVAHSEQVISRSYISDYYNRTHEQAEANAQLIADAGNVRQQIDCSLPELLERYKKMEKAQQKISKRIEHLLDNKIHIKEFVRTAKLAEARKIMSWVNEALNH
jgi:adenylate kinase family enzyme